MPRYLVTPLAKAGVTDPTKTPRKATTTAMEYREVPQTRPEAGMTILIAAQCNPISASFLRG